MSRIIGIGKWWWKVLSVLILMYVIVAGLLIPVNPGILSVMPSTGAGGDTMEVRVKGYNTSFAAGPGDLRAWFKLNDTLALQAVECTVISQRDIVLRFVIPQSVPVRSEVQSVSLVLDDSANGAMVLPNAVILKGMVFTGNSQEWSRTPISRLHDGPGAGFPFRAILYETIRNTYFHVPMWFAMIVMFFASAWFALRYIRTGRVDADDWSLSLASSGLVFGIAGLFTGMIWSTYTWGEPWSFDIKQNTAAITLLIYLAYFVIRRNFDDPQQKARVSAAYNLFGCIMIVPLLFIMPRMTDSLHPGSGGNPALGGEDLDNTMRLIFYPAVVGWTLLGLWLSQVIYRIKRLENRISN